METTKTYVEFMYPGSFFSESSAEVVKSRDPHTLTVPKGAFGFRYYDLTSKKTKVDGEVQTVFGKQKKISGTYFPDGQLFTTEDIRKLGTEYRILLSNMECNNWPRVVKTRRGNFQPFEKNDMII